MKSNAKIPAALSGGREPGYCGAIRDRKETLLSDCCSSCGCGAAPQPSVNPLFRRVVVAALVINAVMFVVEFVGGMVAQSLSLFADSMDFLSDAVNYAITLAVLGLSARAKAGAALVKGLSLGAVGLWVAGNTAWTLLHGTVPRAEIMGGVGLAAFAANAGVALALYRWRHGDANMESIWLCSRNDAIGNVAVLLAASGVWASGSFWPDLGVALVLAALPLQAAARIVRRAVAELRAA